MHVHGGQRRETGGPASPQATGRIEQRDGVAATAEGDQQRPCRSRRRCAFRGGAGERGDRLAQGVEQPLLDGIRLRGSFP